jgi:hypothetical protein
MTVSALMATRNESGFLSSAAKAVQKTGSPDYKVLGNQRTFQHHRILLMYANGVKKMVFERFSNFNIFVGTIIWTHKFLPFFDPAVDGHGRAASSRKHGFETINNLSLMGGVGLLKR